MMPHALAVDDDPNFLSALAELIEGQGFTTNTALNLRDARAQVSHRSPDVALVDLYLPDGSGMDLLKDLESGAATEVVLMTGHADIESAVQALRLGASDYLTKPLDIGRLKNILANVAGSQPGVAAAPATARAAGDVGEESPPEVGRLGLLLGAAEPMLATYEMMNRVAPTDATVLLVGESGTGKDLAATTLHLLSRRAKAPFLPLNCGAISPTLIESELFGHERGSFTGAQHRHKGYFERAHGGTLFLDEISEMPIELQVKLLRVLETGTLARIGGDQQVAVDVRVIAATNRDPHRAVADGKLREDLLYRLQVFPIQMPPLRERDGDVELLASYFLGQLNERQATAKRFSDDAMERLCNHVWPGNVRELKNVIHRAFIMADEEITPRCLPREVGGESGPARSLNFQVGASISDVEQRLIMATLDAYAGNKRKTAEVLGVSLKTLYNRLNMYRVDEV
ncbi:MAG TPA: sigma-54 dependent transcriptional regulator [Thermoanaerobaculia bacterium]|jgi:two-component system response regulator AtoC|nr:sigma-54 dependent transcriptional regulator [Thermoanaerobaculia bacterium]